MSEWTQIGEFMKVLQVFGHFVLIELYEKKGTIIIPDEGGIVPTFGVVVNIGSEVKNKDLVIGDKVQLMLRPPAGKILLDKKACALVDENMILCKVEYSDEDFDTTQRIRPV